MKRILSSFALLGQLAGENVTSATAQSAGQTQKAELDQFFELACPKQWKTSGGILHTSVTHEALPTLLPQRNGFVHTVVQAYGKHHHLRIQRVSWPDDVWTAILTQLSSYYIDWRCKIYCGIPSVTLEGERADWERLYKRLDRLPELGNEPAQWAAMLRPIVYRFIKAFDGEPDLVFWSHVVNRTYEGCGSQVSSGWITAFCVWDSKGKWLARNRRAPSDSMGSVMADNGRSYMRPAYTLDGVPCFSLDMVDIPAGCCEVDVMIEGMEYAMVAGNVASRVSASDTICTGRERWVGHAEPRFTVVYVCKEMMWDADKLIGMYLYLQTLPCALYGALNKTYYSRETSVRS